MKTTDQRLIELLPNWLMATASGNSPVAAIDADLDSAIAEFRIQLKDGQKPSPGRLDRDLLLLSSVCRTLLSPSEKWSGSLEEVATAYEFALSISTPNDRWGEIGEILCQLAFAGWKKAQSSRNAEKWLTRFREGFGRALVFQDYVRLFLSSGVSARSDEINHSVLSDSFNLMAICVYLWGQVELNPELVLRESSAIYGWLKANRELFDHGERVFFLGESALIAGGECRILALWSAAETWLGLAERWLAQSRNVEGRIAKIEYMRCALSWENGLFDEAMRLLPDVTSSFQRLGMDDDLMKAEVFAAVTLKVNGHAAEARDLLEGIRRVQSRVRDKTAYAHVLVCLYDALHLLNRPVEAQVVYEEALASLKEFPNHVAAANLKQTVGAALRQDGRVVEAIAVLHDSAREFRRLGIVHFDVMVSLMSAEALLSIDREREAELEVAEALPKIAARRLNTERVAASVLLREIRIRRNRRAGSADSRGNQ